MIFGEMDRVWQAQITELLAKARWSITNYQVTQKEANFVRQLWEAFDGYGDRFRISQTQVHWLIVIVHKYPMTAG
jgi:hypothetical protein